MKEMKSKTLMERKEELLKEISLLEKKQIDFEKQMEFRVSTNTAYILNSKLFDGWKDFKEFIETKHEQHWKRENSSHVEVIFKIKKEDFK